MKSKKFTQHTHQNDLIAMAAAGDRHAQRQVYELFKGKMFGVCLRYAVSPAEAEDLLQEGFIKVFRDLHQFRGTGSFEGWVRRVIVNNALQHLKKHRKSLLTAYLDDHAYQMGEEDTHPWQQEEENICDTLLRLMQKMPVGFRTVLNLYILEGYSHAQIAEQLGISEGTSKSQLNRAKACLRGLLEKCLSQ